jgi:hypothetical protein
VVGLGEWTYITLESAAFVDREDEDDVLAGFECLLEDVAVLNLGSPN